jgi:hypothetical protein
MTTYSPSQGPSPSPAARSVWRSQTRRDQLFAGTLGVVLLIASMLAHSYVNSRRSAWDLVREDPESEKTLRSLAVAFPRLTLGGMRGIVSTYLWMQAEDDKNERRWVDLETKYDIIGALQPYFASVYIFHSWNQAYNLSAQWQEEEIKYKWVLDGLAYIYKGEEYNPGNPDIYLEEAQLYFLKLGSAAERIFYREHWRSDLARLHELNNAPEVKDDATIALQHVRDVINRTDPRDRSTHYFNIEERRDPQTHTLGYGIYISDPVINPKTGFNLFKDRTDGKKVTDPVEFPYGVSPFYFGYIEYNRCLALDVGPTYTGLQVIDAFPAMCLRLWCRDDLYYSAQTMNRLFGAHPDEALLKDNGKFSAKVDEIKYCYRNVAMIGPRAIDLFNGHLQRYPGNRFIHTKHKLETQAYIDIAKAESKLFTTLVQWQLAGRDKNKFVADFQEADTLYKAAYATTMQWVDNMYPAIVGQPPNPDRDDFARYALALQNRSRGIEALLTTPANQQPDMSFLGGEENDVVEK